MQLKYTFFTGFYNSKRGAFSQGFPQKSFVVFLLQSIKYSKFILNTRPCGKKRQQGAARAPAGPCAVQKRAPNPAAGMQRWAAAPPGQRLAGVGRAVHFGPARRFWGGAFWPEFSSLAAFGWGGETGFSRAFWPPRPAPGPKRCTRAAGKERRFLQPRVQIVHFYARNTSKIQQPRGRNGIAIDASL